MNRPHVIPTALGIQLWRDPSFPYHDFSTIVRSRSRDDWFVLG
jgi:hypothetical protein